MRPLLLLFFISVYVNGYCQSKPFVPIEFEYPASILKVPKTYIYSKEDGSSPDFRDVIMTKKPGQIIINCKSYNDKSIEDSSVEINDKSVERYVFLDKMFKTTITEDSLYMNGSRLGEKVQSEYIKIEPSFVISIIIHSSFSKDTSLVWDKQQINCLVIKSNVTTNIINTSDRSKKSSSSNVLYYFGKDVGLMKYTVKEDGKIDSWYLRQIKELKK